jgi:hypothetical protein
MKRTVNSPSLSYCTSWQHGFNAFRKWRQSNKRVLKTNESFIVILYIVATKWLTPQLSPSREATSLSATEEFSNIL